MGSAGTVLALERVFVCVGGCSFLSTMYLCVNVGVVRSTFLGELHSSINFQNEHIFPRAFIYAHLMMEVWLTIGTNTHEMDH